MFICIKHHMLTCRYLSSVILFHFTDLKKKKPQTNKPSPIMEWHIGTQGYRYDVIPIFPLTCQHMVEWSAFTWPHFISQLQEPATNFNSWVTGVPLTGLYALSLLWETSTLTTTPLKHHDKYIIRIGYGERMIENDQF